MKHISKTLVVCSLILFSELLVPAIAQLSGGAGGRSGLGSGASGVAQNGSFQNTTNPGNNVPSQPISRSVPAQQSHTQTNPNLGTPQNPYSRTPVNGGSVNGSH